MVKISRSLFFFLLINLNIVQASEPASCTAAAVAWTWDNFWHTRIRYYIAFAERPTCDDALKYTSNQAKRVARTSRAATVANNSKTKPYICAGIGFGIFFNVYPFSESGTTISEIRDKHLCDSLTNDTDCLCNVPSIKNYSANKSGIFIVPGKPTAGYPNTIQ